jgi:anti-anti-sigma factor
MADATGQPVATHISLTPRLLRQLGAPSSTMRAFVERDDAAVVVYVGGEVDARNESTWRRLLGEAAVAAAPGAVLIVDLRGLRFVSCSAMEALIRQSHWCRRYGVQLRLVTEQAVIRQVVQACVPAHEMPIFPSVDVALDRSDRHCVRPAQSGEQPDGLSGMHLAADSATTSPPPALSRRSAQLWSLRIAGLSDLVRRRRQRVRHVGYTTVVDAQRVSTPSVG